MRYLTHAIRKLGWGYTEECGYTDSHIARQASIEDPLPITGLQIMTPRRAYTWHGVCERERSDIQCIEPLQRCEV